MAEFKRKTSVQKTVESDTVEETPSGPDSAVVDDTDALLDEIDSVLEENAQEFVEQYVQKGGE